MNKRSLMLSAAAAALLSSPAMAATTIATTVTSTQKTSSTGDLTISPGGVITFKSQTDPLINIDSNAIVINNGNLTSTDSTNQTAVLINATGLTGSYTQNGNMDLSGTGVSKKGLFLSGASTFTGNITFASTSVVNIVGDQSVGVLTDAQSTLNGDISLGGQFTVSQSSVSNTTASNVLAMALPGVINGNVGVISGSTIGAVGANAVAIAITGPLHACVVAGCTSIGTFKNEGSIVSTGILNRSATATNPEGGSTVIIAGNLDGGFLNNGLTSSGDAVNHAGTISGNGSPISSPGSVILVGSSTNSVTLGAVTGDFNGTYGFINRGGIVAAPVDANQFTRAVVLQGGSATTPTNIKGGVFSSGSITANTTSTTGGNGVTATAIEVDNYITIPEIRASGQSFVQGANRGTIAANISGPLGGTAAAILINGTTGTSVPLITVEQNATVSANAQVVDPSATVPTGFILNAIAIQDSSNSLAILLNQGTISATATTLTNGFTSTARAVMAQNNTTALNFTNSGTVTGDVLFGSGSDTYTIQGANQNAIARHTGTIDFGLSNANGGTGDTLHVAQFSNVAGTIKATGTLDVAVDPTGILTVQNIGTTVATRNFAVAGGNGAGAGTVNVTVSSGVGTGGVIQSNVVTFGSGANLNVQYGSFIPLTGTSTNFVLLSANKGQLGISDADVARYSASVGGSTTLPFLFRTAGIAKDLSDPSRDKLVLTVTPKTQAELNLTGYGAATFAQANIAAGVDSTLGSALVQGVTAANVQSAYDAFAPDVTGGTRAIAVALTDQASGQVAARQRTLRMFAKNPGELTLWGTEFAQYISSPARTGGAVATNGTITAPGTVNGFKDRGFGFSVGIDEGSPETGWYGAAFTFYTGDVAETGNRVLDHSSSLWYMFTGYTTWRGRGVFLDTQLSVAINNVKGKRFLSLAQPGGTTFLREADNKHAGLVGSFGATMGAQFNYGQYTHVIPQLSLDGMTMREEGYTESGGGTGFNLKTSPTYNNSLRVFLGSEFRQDLNLGDFFLQPSFKLGYRYDFMAKATRIKAQFLDIDPNTSGNQLGTLFTLQGPRPSQGNYVAGANINASTENWTIGLNYDFVRGSHNETEQVGSISLLGRI